MDIVARVHEMIAEHGEDFLLDLGLDMMPIDIRLRTIEEDIIRKFKEYNYRPNVLTDREKKLLKIAINHFQKYINKTMDQRESVQTQIIKIIQSEYVDSSIEIDRYMRLSKELDLDSLDIVDVVMRLEREFDISVPDEHIDQLDTVGHLSDLIWQLIQQKRILKK